MGENVTNNDLFKLIQELVNKTNEIQNQNIEIKKDLTQEIRTIQFEITEKLEKIKKENIELKEENQTLKNRLSAIEKKVKKYNLIFYGVEEQDNDIDEIQYFLDTINKHLQISFNFSDIRDIYRFGKKVEGKSRPISVEFVSYPLKIDILKNAKKLKGTGVFIANDYTTEEYEKQKVLRAHLIIARRNNQQATIKNNTLYVDGEAFTYEELKERKDDLIEEEETEESEETEVTETGNIALNNETAGSSTNLAKDKVYSFFNKTIDKKRKQQPTEIEIPRKRTTRTTNKKTVNFA